jgi:hypothetical protein
VNPVRIAPEQAAGAEARFGTGHEGNRPMLEINTQLTRLKEIKSRTDSLRGYL